MGVILGLTVLARIDAVFFVILVSLWQFYSYWRQGKIQTGMLRFVLIGGIAFLVSSPWWLYNQLQFSSLMPISGKAQQAWQLSAERLGMGIAAVSQDLMPPLYTGKFHNLPLVLVQCVFIGVVGMGIRSGIQ